MKSDGTMRACHSFLEGIMERDIRGPVYELHRVFTLSGTDSAERTRGREAPVGAMHGAQVGTEPSSADADAGYGLTATKSS